MRIKCLFVEFNGFLLSCSLNQIAGRVTDVQEPHFAHSWFRRYPAWLCYAWYTRFVDGRRDHKAVGACGWRGGLKKRRFKRDFLL